MMRSWWYITSPKTCGAKVIIRCGDEMLLIKTTYGYAYGLLGGGIKKYESPVDTACREVQKEVGISLGELSPLLTFLNICYFWIHFL